MSAEAHDEQTLRRRICEALMACGKDVPNPTITDEQLAAFATQVLAPPERRVVMRAAASDPELAAVLAELARLGVGRRNPEGAGESLPSGPLAFPRRLAAAMATAAVLMLALFLWGALSPAPPSLTGAELSPANVPHVTVPGAPDYWQVHEDEQRSRFGFLLRDIALYISIATTAVLALLVTLLTIWRRPAVQPTPDT